MMWEILDIELPNGISKILVIMSPIIRFFKIRNKVDFYMGIEIITGWLLDSESGFEYLFALCSDAWIVLSFKFDIKKDTNSKKSIADRLELEFRYYFIREE